jgi:hypothetical protein
MTLVGYYQASERLDDTALAPVGERVAQKIRDQFNDAVAFVVSKCMNHSWKNYLIVVSRLTATSWERGIQLYSYV